MRIIAGKDEPEMMVQHKLRREECPECRGWRVIYLKPGIPNETRPCLTCKGTGYVLTKTEKVSEDAKLEGV